MNENVSLLFQVQIFFFFQSKGSFSFFFFFFSFPFEGEINIMLHTKKYQVQFTFKNHLCGTNHVEDEITTRMTKNS